jgi:hypothetical protein
MEIDSKIKDIQNIFRINYDQLNGMFYIFIKTFKIYFFILKKNNFRCTRK